METFKKLLFLFTPHERKRAGLLLIMIIIMALLDMIGVAFILPFMAVLTSPDLIETNDTLNIMFQLLSIFGVENNQQFLFILGIFVFILLVVSQVFKVVTTYFQVRFIEMREYSIGKRLIESYLIIIVPCIPISTCLKPLFSSTTLQNKSSKRPVLIGTNHHSIS